MYYQKIYPIYQFAKNNADWYFKVIKKNIDQILNWLFMIQ